MWIVGNSETAAGLDAFVLMDVGSAAGGDAHRGSCRAGPIIEAAVDRCISVVDSGLVGDKDCITPGASASSLMVFDDEVGVVVFPIGPRARLLGS